MSVLNQSGDEKVECPLCMEPLEVDDLNFFPCTCGYQICRFCWHRIRTDENGLCPHCRKAYSEDPADFIPLSQEQVAKLKAEKRQRDQQRKAKLSESRKHLASVRVVQRNLVFVVGLPVRLADPEILKKHEYFGKFGKIHKVVINQSTAYAGSQGPSASAYVTYLKSDDALRAIQSVNNITIDGRQIKSSLGTTKYCSHFMKNQPCPKADCMYLHDFGDPEASFTKEQMHAGKHQEYEKKLHDSLLQRGTSGTVQANGAVNTAPSPANSTAVVNGDGKKCTTVGNGKESCNSGTSSSGSSQNGKENWPQLKNDTKSTNNKHETNNNNSSSNSNSNKGKSKSRDKKEKRQRITNQDVFVHELDVDDDDDEDENSKSNDGTSDEIVSENGHDNKTTNDDNSSFFSHNHHPRTPSADFDALLQHANNSDEDDEDEDEEEGGEDGEETPPELTDSLPDISTTEDWVAAFGLRKDDENQDRNVQQTTSNGVPYTFPTLFDSDKVQTDLLDVLVNKNNAFQTQDNSSNGSSNNFGDLDRHMSKFFNNLQQPLVQHQQHQQKNTYNGLNNGYPSNTERLLLMQQKKIELQLMNLSLNGIKQQQPPNHYAQQPLHYMNGDNGTCTMQNGYSYGGYNSFQQIASHFKQQKPQVHEADLDFDPIQETQKAFAEMIKEQNPQSTAHNCPARSSLSQMNGFIGQHNHHPTGLSNGTKVGHLPPPPPGFVQPQSTHMNSFGSKILPFLNMNQQQQQQQQQQQNGAHNSWPSNGSYTGTQVAPMSHQLNKNVNGYDDWKSFDSAILSTSRHYPLNVPPQRVPQQQQQQPTQQQQQQMNGFLRPDEFALLSSFQLGQQQQHNYNNYTSTTHLSQPNYNNWFGSDLNTQISSPPGFRPTNQTSKQQEC